MNRRTQRQTSALNATERINLRRRKHIPSLCVPPARPTLRYTEPYEARAQRVTSALSLSAPQRLVHRRAPRSGSQRPRLEALFVIIGSVFACMMRP